MPSASFSQRISCGYPEPEERYLERLRELVGVAARNGLRVQLTLFDWWGAYRDIEGSKQWARAVLERYSATHGLRSSSSGTRSTRRTGTRSRGRAS